MREAGVTTSHKRHRTRMMSIMPWFRTVSAELSAAKSNRRSRGKRRFGSPESSTNVVMLDDMSPRCMKAAAALQGL